MLFFRRASGCVLATATAISVAIAPLATATPAGDNLVISEAYGGGGNAGATYTHDFVELYNPTDAPITLDGLFVQYLSTSGNVGAVTPLSGSIAPQDYFLIEMAPGSGGTEALQADLVGNPPAAMSGKGGSIVLTDSEARYTAGAPALDILGWNNAAVAEGTALGAASNTTSAQRIDAAVDTDNNAADFHIAAPTPQGAGSAPGDNPDTPDETPEETTTPEVPTSPGEVTTIADIQGTDVTAPNVGQVVTTQGYVTSSYPEGGFDGFHIQTGGTGANPKQSGEASDGLFIWQGSGENLPAIGSCVIVTGTVAEYGNAGTSTTQLKSPTVTEGTDCGEAITPIQIDTMPADPALREAYENMLVQPTGAYTVTNNYQLNTYGSVDLAAGTEPYYQGTDVEFPSTDPNSPVQQLIQHQEAEVVTLDDGRSANYMKSDKTTPLPYLAQDGAATIKPIRTGDGVSFQQPVIFDQRFNVWNYQPTTPITGATAGTELPITWEDSRPAVLDVPKTVAGDFSIASFNVLNYFTSLGEDEAGCGSYQDMNGTPVTANGCTVRGAYTDSAFQDQQAKIVSAINMLDVSVLGLEEIENTAAVTGDVTRRDEALANLVQQLNAAGGNWEYVKSPTALPSSEDVIRVAFIYDKDQVTPVGDSVIFDTAEFAGTARQPLAQEFASVANPEQTFVGIVNHFKSKGSVAHGDTDMGDGQGNNANLRVEQSKALLRELGNQSQWNDKPVFILGDLNSYSKEAAVTTLLEGGFTNLMTDRAEATPSYQFDGRLGSLDHALANDAALALVQDAKVWDINSDESVAFEYSRRHYNVVDYYAPDPFRSSDHDPIKVGFNLSGKASEQPGDPLVPGTGDALGSSESSSNLPWGS